MLTETYGGKTYTYTYDAAGNILTSSDGSTTKSYTYGDSNWKDLLTAYNGQTISYDAIGNPTSWYDGTTFGWSNGRRLTSAVNSSTGLNNSYTYDADGLRLTKTVGSEQHKYVWQGSTLVSEYYGGKTLEFFYDESGTPYAFSYRSSSTATPAMYYYVTNLQGDVTNVLDASGSIVASYTYNAWGKLLSSSGSMADINPIRYRGYYFDSDSGLYYLKSRYYDPQLARFINADGQVDTGNPTGTNLFAYCGNNPTNRIDAEGNAWWHWAIGAGIVVGCAVATVVTAGGFAAAAMAVGMVSSGIAATTVASTVAASAFIGSSLAFGVSAISAAVSSNTCQDFYDQGNWGTVAATAGGAIAGGIAGGLSNNSGVTSTGKGFDTYRQLKNEIGSPGAGNEWHHIVEQSQISKSGFHPQMIQNTNNILPVNKATHRAISGYYSSIQPFTNGMTVRNWLAGQSFSVQYEFGINVIKMFK